MTQAAAIYTRVSSDRQKEEHTIASQTAALMEYAQKHSYVVPPEWVFQDEGMVLVWIRRKKATAGDPRIQSMFHDLAP